MLDDAVGTSGNHQGTSSSLSSPPPAPPRPPGPAPARRHRTVFAVITAAVFMANLDLFVVNVAFPGIRADLGGDVAGLSWVLNAYATSP